MNVSEKAELVNNAREKAIVSVKAYAKPKLISAIFEMVISIIAITGIQFVECGLNFNALLSWEFWVKVGCCTIGIFLLYRAIVNARFEKTALRENVVKAKEQYNELNSKKDLSLKEFLKEFNLQTKIETYIGIQNKKISKVENKLVNCFNIDKKVKLEKRLDELKETISEEYVKAHIENMHIKYYVVFYSDFQDENTYGKSNGVYTRGNYDSAFNKASFNKMWMYVLSSALLGISVFTSSEYTVVSVMTNIISATVMVTTRIVTALLEADVLYDKTITRSIYSRTEILQQFFLWKENHPTPTQLEAEYERAKSNAKLEYEKDIQEQVNARVQKEIEQLKEKLDQVQ